MALGTTEVRPRASGLRRVSERAPSSRALRSERKVLVGGPGAPATSSPVVLPGEPWLPQLFQLHQRPNVGPPRPGHCQTQGASAEAHLQGRRPVSH